MINWAYMILFIVLWYVTVLTHEVGHALMSRILFGYNGAITIGRGKPILTTNWLIINSAFWYFGEGSVPNFKSVGKRY